MGWNECCGAVVIGFAFAASLLVCMVEASRRYDMQNPLLRVAREAPALVAWNERGILTGFQFLNCKTIDDAPDQPRLGRMVFTS